MCNAIMNVMYSFLQEPFFPTGFSDGFFDEACAYRGSRANGECCKTYGLYPRRKGEGGILNLVHLYVDSY